MKNIIVLSSGLQLQIVEYASKNLYKRCNGQAFVLSFMPAISCLPEGEQTNQLALYASCLVTADEIWIFTPTVEQLDMFNQEISIAESLNKTIRRMKLFEDADALVKGKFREGQKLRVITFHHKNETDLPTGAVVTFVTYVQTEGSDRCCIVRYNNLDWCVRERDLVAHKNK